MSDLEQRCLDAFPEWLRTLGADVLELAKVLADESQAESCRRQVAGAVNYLFKSLDLIPDGIEDLGFIDDAFVLRVAAAHAASGGGPNDALARLAGEATLVREFLGEDYPRLEGFVSELATSAARGRTVDQIIEDSGIRSQLLGDVKGWMASYHPPSFSRDEKNLIKLRSFLKTKLPGSAGYAGDRHGDADD